MTWLGVLEAGGWGLLAGSALVVGAVLGYQLSLPGRLVAGVMAFGSGVLLSAVSFELIAEAEDRAGLLPAVLGAVIGALLYSGANVVLARRGARHRKRSGTQQAAEGGGSGVALAVGATLDGVPESIVIGASLVGGGAVSVVTVAAVFLSNLPEGLSSSSGMRRAGRGPGYVYGLWSGIAVVTAMSAAGGFLLAGVLAPFALASVTALAGGAILAMIADTMIPEAFEQAHLATGLITVLGFLAAFALSRIGG
jgi:ZIP family zinc transporter